MDISWHLKYRPIRFSDYAGSQQNVQTIKQAILKNRLPPTIILSGPRGLGKTSLARTISMTLNCTDIKEGEPCLVCDNCKKTQQSLNVDVIETDAATSRGIDSIKSLKNLTQYKPVSGKYKVFILDEVHMLTTEGWNALLKVLEEPPQNVVFILCTTETQNIPQTVYSRAMTFVFQRMSVFDISKRLEYIANIEGIQFDKETLDKIAESSNGGMRDSVQMLEQCYLLAGKVDLEVFSRIKLSVDREDAYVLVALLLKGDVQKVVESVSEASSKYSSLFDLFNLVSDVLCDLGHCIAGFSPDSFSDDKIKRLAALYRDKGIRFARIYETVMSITRDLGDMRKSQNASPSLFKLIAVKCCWVLSGKWSLEKKPVSIDIQEPRQVKEEDRGAQLDNAVNFSKSIPKADHMSEFRNLIEDMD